MVIKQESDDTEYLNSEKVKTLIYFWTHNIKLFYFRDTEFQSDDDGHVHKHFESTFGLNFKLVDCPTHK